MMHWLQERPPNAAQGFLVGAVFLFIGSLATTPPSWDELERAEGQVIDVSVDEGSELLRIRMRQDNGEELLTFARIGKGRHLDNAETVVDGNVVVYFYDGLFSYFQPPEALQIESRGEIVISFDEHSPKQRAQFAIVLTLAVAFMIVGLILWRKTSTGQRHRGS